MSGYRLCQTKMAEVPYYIEHINVNIYSLEELCYYIYHNMYLLDETIVNGGLLEWISNELNLKKLYHALCKELEEFHSMGDFVLLIFKEINYLTHQEFKVFNAKLVRLEHEPEIAREKIKADYLVEKQKYVSAIRIYKAILDRVKGSRLGGQFVGEIYYNMGCAYMRLFQYDEAFACFTTAYERLPDSHMLEAYLTACYIIKPYAYYRRLTQRLCVPEKMLETLEERVQKIQDTVSGQIDLAKKDEFLKKIREDYHNSSNH